MIFSIFTLENGLQLAYFENGRRGRSVPTGFVKVKGADVVGHRHSSRG